jgi:hypothetical protein
VLGSLLGLGSLEAVPAYVHRGGVSAKGARLFSEVILLVLQFVTGWTGSQMLHGVRSTCSGLPNSSIKSNQGLKKAKAPKLAVTGCQGQGSGGTEVLCWVQKSGFAVVNCPCHSRSATVNKCTTP